MGLLLGALALWAALVVWLAPLPIPAQPWLAVVVAIFASWAIWRTSRRWPVVLVAVLFVVVVLAWHSIRPSHDRQWRREVAVMPRIAIDGDRIRISGYRNFDYRTRDDFSERWEERELALSALQSMDFFVSYWEPDGAIAHTLVSFNFADAAPVAISIEIRPETGESFHPLLGLFRHYELAYVVGDERDIVRVRSNYRDEQVFLYRLRVPADGAQRLFRVYAQRINALADTPEFYNVVSNNCTVNIVRYANQAGRMGGWDIRHLLNGWSDQYLYDVGLVDTSIPFEDLRQRSIINVAAAAADQDADFSRLIRAGRPVPPRVPAPAPASH